MRPHAPRLSRTLWPTLVLSSVAALSVAYLIASRREAPAPPAAAAQTQPSGETYGRLPMSFEANRGQAEGSVDFLARGEGYSLFLKNSEAVFALRSKEPDPRPKVLRMKLVGSDISARAEGADELEGKTNYLFGDDPSQWQTDVPTYGRVRYAGVYAGVDLVYYGNQRQLEYDFRVAPGADPRAVALKFEGADAVELGANGDLLLKLGETFVRQPRPFAYQESAGARREVEAAYAVGADGLVRFRLGGFDPALPLVIDPVFAYSTFIGGSLGWDVAVDPAGNAYVAGSTVSDNFPTVNPLQAARGGLRDAFVKKINAAGTAVVYSTYLGGRDDDEARRIAVDSDGNAYVKGVTVSDNFPTANAFDSTYNGGGDAFVSKLNPSGSALVYSTYLGGGGNDGAPDHLLGDFDFASGIAVDSAGNAYVTGTTGSTDFPTANAIDNTLGGGGDAFLTKLNAAGSALVYSTYLGGGGGDSGIDVAVDSAGDAYVTGTTSSTDFPTANPRQATLRGPSDAFVTKVNAAGSALVYSTYLGGGFGSEFGHAIAVDAAGNAYVTGETFSIDFPTTLGAFQTLHGNVNGGPPQDAFLTKYNADGSAVVYSTFLGGGGAGGETGYGVAVDSAGNAYVAGNVSFPSNFPTTNALQCRSDNNNEDAFLTKFNATGSALVYSTLLGARRARGVAVDAAGNAYVTGAAFDLFLPVTNALQSVPGPGGAFLAKVNDAAATASAFRFSQAIYFVDEDVTSANLVVQRTGNLSAPATVDYSTSDRLASERSDYSTAVGTLRFAAGQSEATLPVLINEDSFGGDSDRDDFNVVLSNPTGGAAISCPEGTATVRIADEVEPQTNAIDDPATFVGTHYHDFLNRQADTAGLNFWADQLTACGADAACVDRKRAAVSTAFFLSIEFQQTAFYVFRVYRASFPDSAARPRGMPRYREFLRGQQEVGRGVVVNQAGWEQVLETNKDEFARRWVQRPDFLAEFPADMTFDAYVAKLAANSGVTLTPTEINVLFEGWDSTVNGRARTLRRVVELGSVYNRQFNAGFVFSQYVGYLRRNPNDAPDIDYTGFDFWLAKLDSFSLPGEDVRDPQTALTRANRAEMVRAFIRSTEYRQRFGLP
ncbi:MAG: SBBP repeat-containing protein [Acidobacteria bacterium]|nr:SBBP repeat-containing protein [Acidobacteriota bacterium]